MSLTKRMWRDYTGIVVWRDSKRFGTLVSYKVESLQSCAKGMSIGIQFLDTENIADIIKTMEVCGRICSLKKQNE